MEVRSQRSRGEGGAWCALVSGGGSGGHVFPGLALAAELDRRGWRVDWAGSASGMEARLVAGRGIDFHDLPARPVSGRGLPARVGALLTLGRSALTARSLVRRLGARVVVGTGGYVSAPAVVGGRLARRPVLLFEPNAEPGLANRWLSRLASEAAVAYEETGAGLVCPARRTGVPVRDAFFATARELPAAPPTRLLVLGGSQGARQLNELLPRALAQLAAEGALPAGGLAVLHQAGATKLEATRAAYAAADPEGVEVEITPFLDDVAAAMAVSHLLVSRAGAITLAEICAAARPALLVPLATAAGGHQTANARRLREAGVAEMLPPGEADAETMACLLGGLLAEPERLRRMATAAGALGRSDAASALADRVEHLGRAG